MSIAGASAPRSGASAEPSIKVARAALLGRAELVGGPLRAELTALYDRWLAGLLSNRPGVALLAVGGLGRSEPTPYGDLDLVLLHDGTVADVSAIADAVWYPIWDAGLGLDHSVRTPDQAITLAGTDLKVLLGLLDARHLAGDPALTALLREQIVAGWRRSAPGRLAELQELARARWERSGEASFLLEPDLKDCRGGLRDWVGLRALASAQLLDLTAPVVAAAGLLADVRGELHRACGRAGDVLRAAEREPVATALKLRGGERDLAGGDAVLRAVHEAARTLAYATDVAWRRVAGTVPKPLLRRLRPGVPPAVMLRQPLARDVVRQGGEVVLARNADPWADPVLVLRVARAAATAALPISPYTLTRLATEAAPLPEPWPVAARAELVALLGAGRPAVGVFEALDQHGLLGRLIPEWQAVRFKAQHNPVHRFTVDRHLIETAVRAAERAAEVARPDLLLVGALLHDIGKGYPGDHSEVGGRLAGRIALRLGFGAEDAAVIAALARHHLLLPDTATRRDPDDPSTIGIVVAAIGGSGSLLELLHALTVADAAATGPAAWSDWKARLIGQLVQRTSRVLGGGPLPAAEPASAAVLELARGGVPRVVIEDPDPGGAEVLVVAPDAPGLLSAAAGLLALHSLDVRAAAVRTVGGMAVNRFTVAPRFGELPDPALLNGDLRRILAGGLDLDARLRAKESSYRSESSYRAESSNRTGSSHRAEAERSAQTRLLWFDDQARNATVLEVRTRDAIGLLHRLTAALELCGANISSARISSLGPFVVDAFYLTDADGKPLSEQHRILIETELS